MPDCEAILVVEQERYAARIGPRGGDGRVRTTVSEAGDEIIPPTFGLRCRLGDFYAKTSLALGRVKRRPPRR